MRPLTVLEPGIQPSFLMGKLGFCGYTFRIVLSAGTGPAETFPVAEQVAALVSGASQWYAGWENDLVAREGTLFASPRPSSCRFADWCSRSNFGGGEIDKLCSGRARAVLQDVCY